MDIDAIYGSVTLNATYESLGDEWEGICSVRLFIPETDKEYTFDVIESGWFYDGDNTYVDLKFETDEDELKEIFTDCKFNLETEDLTNENIRAEVYAGRIENEFVGGSIYAVFLDKAISIPLTLQD